MGAAGDGVALDPSVGAVGQEHPVAHVGDGEDHVDVFGVSDIPLSNDCE